MWSGPRTPPWSPSSAAPASSPRRGRTPWRRATNSCSWPPRPARSNWRICCRCAARKRRAEVFEAYDDGGRPACAGRPPSSSVEVPGLRLAPVPPGRGLRVPTLRGLSRLALLLGLLLRLHLREHVDRSRRLREEDPGQPYGQQEGRDLEGDQHPAELRGVRPPVQREEDRALGEQDRAPGVTGLGVRLLAPRVAGPPGEVLL